MHRGLVLLLIILFGKTNGQSNIDLRILTSSSQTLYVSMGLRVNNILEVLNANNFENITLQADTGVITKDTQNKYLYFCDYPISPKNVEITIYNKSVKLLTKKYCVKRMPDPFLCLSNNYKEAQHGEISKNLLLKLKKLLIVLPNTDYIIKDIIKVKELTIKFPDKSSLISHDISLTKDMVEKIKSLKTNQKIEAVCIVHDIRNNKDFNVYGFYTLK